jgi:hypothetical protein
LSENTRNEIAENNKIGAGSVSNIISDFKRGIESSEFDSIREFAIWSKKEGMTMSNVVAHVRLINYIKKLGVNFDELESFIKNIAASQKLLDTANQIAKIETVPLDKLVDHIK